MARAQEWKPSASKGTKAKKLDSGIRHHEIFGVVLLGVTIFLLAGLFSLQLGTGRLVGPLGRWLAVTTYSLIGIGAYLLAIGLGWSALRSILGQRMISRPTVAIGVMLTVVSVVTLLHLAFSQFRTEGYSPGGLLGEHLAEISRAVVSTVGTALFCVLLLLLACVIATPVRIGSLLTFSGRGARWLGWGLFSGAKRAGVEVAGFSGDVIRSVLPERQEVTTTKPARKSPRRDDTEDEIIDLIRRKSSSEPEIVSSKHMLARTGPVSSAPTAEMADDTEKMSSDAVNQISTAVVKKIVNGTTGSDQASAAPESSGKKSRKKDTAIGMGSWATPPQLAGKSADVASTALEVLPEAIVAVTAEAGPAKQPVIVESQFKHPKAAEMKAKEKQVDRQRRDFTILGQGEFKLPPIHLLEYDESQAGTIDRSAMLEMSARLSQTLDNYGVKGEVTAIRPGPVVTMYEFAPAPGIRISKIANLSDDLAMSLEALKVRIVAPIPGKAVVGVEVPNRGRETVYLKEILANDAFVGTKAKLPIAIGKDIEGGPSVVDLAKMPHLLVAGTTGSGKSVAVNAMITSLLYCATPEDVRMIMVDPKMLELSIYEGIPHLLLPVVTDPKKANLALRWAVDEMERRYELLARMGVRDIATYNKKMSKKADEHEAQELAESSPEDAMADELPTAESSGQMQLSEPPPTKLPYIVVVIDEFADLMMCAPKDVETSVARIAQKARAAGIHLILATQRPSVDVITGLIKANFPSRIAFHVTAKVDSRTILDQGGAESLLGAGDMLFSDRGAAPQRLHGCYVNEDEIHRVVEFLKKQGKPVYNLEILKPRDEDEDGESTGGDGEDEISDDLYDKAVQIVAESQKVSVSYLQRRLSVGYNRAAKMVERMEKEGVVSAPDNKKIREVLVSSA